MSTNCHASTTSDTNLNAAFRARRTLLQSRKQIRNIIPRMTIQTRAQPLLIKEVRNQTNTATQDKQAVQNAHAQIILGLLGAKRAAVAHEVDEADGHAAVDVED